MLVEPWAYPPPSWLAGLTPVAVAGTPYWLECDTTYPAVPSPAHADWAVLGVTALPAFRESV